MIYGKYIIALCIPRIHDATNHKFITSMSKQLDKYGARLLVYSTPSELFWNSIDEQGEKTVFDLINYDITDAVIIHSESIKNKDVVAEVINKSKSHGKPVIAIGSNCEGCTDVGFDYRAGFEKIVRHVLQDHHVCDFHMIAGYKDNAFSDERIEVVRKVAEELELPFCDDDISYGNFWSQPTEQAVEMLFTRRRRLPQAIICANDAMAITTITTLKRHGVRVPEDIIVTGFDSIAEADYCCPRLTTCLCSSEQLADTVTDTVMALIRGERVPEHRLVVPVLQKSESCGCTSERSIDPSAELTYINNSFYRYQSEEENMFRMMPRILVCRDFSQVADVLDKYDFYDMLIALSPECMDPTHDPLKPTCSSPFSDKVKIIYNTDTPMHGRIDDADTMSLHPDLENVLNDHSEPLIIFSLNYMGITMGYVCFNYHNYDIQNYYKATQIVNTLNSAFGAFRVLHYQHFLSEKIEEMYRCDGLTHLLNRTAMKNDYPELLKKCGGKLTVVLSDLDGLKHINDNYGHDDGDFAIFTVASALKNSCPDGSLCVRWGGDEMVAVIPGGLPCFDIHQKIDEYIEKVNSVSGKPYKISASVGILSFSTDETDDLEFMVKSTDMLMYAEKEKKHSQEVSV